MKRFAGLKKRLLAMGLAVAVAGCASSSWLAAEYGEPYSLSLGVHPPFGQSIFYQVVNSDACRFVYNPDVPQRGGNIHDTPYQKFILSHKQCAVIREQTRVALNATPHEIDRPGFDGSVWRLSSSLSQGLGITAWEPVQHASERGYVELVRLRRLLDSIVSNSGGNHYGVDE